MAVNEAFGWLNSIMDAVICVFPKREVVPDTHGGVRYKYGRRKPLEGGRVVWYWPLVTKIQTYPKNRQTCNLENQTLTTKDGRTIGLSGIVVFEVPDPFTFLTEVWDGEDTIRDIVLSNISNFIEQNTLEEVRGNFRRVRARVKRSLERFGIEVKKVTLSHNIELARVYGLWPAGGDSPSRWIKSSEES